MSIQRLKKALKEQKLTIGERTVEKKVKNGNAKVVFLAKNCKKKVRKDMKYYEQEGNIEVVELDLNAEEVGTICKKQFAVSTICY